MLSHAPCRLKLKMIFGPTGCVASAALWKCEMACLSLLCASSWTSGIVSYNSGNCHDEIELNRVISFENSCGCIFMMFPQSKSNVQSISRWIACGRNGIYAFHVFQWICEFIKSLAWALLFENIECGESIGMWFKSVFCVFFFFLSSSHSFPVLVERQPKGFMQTSMNGQMDPRRGQLGTSSCEPNRMWFLALCTSRVDNSFFFMLVQIVVDWSLSGMTLKCK